MKENNSYINLLKQNGHNINIHNLTEDENIFIPNMNEKYWYIHTWDGNISQVKNNLNSFCDTRRESEADDLLFVLNRVFKTKEECQKYIDFLIAKVKLEFEIFKLNRTWKPNWNDENNKYIIYYNNNINMKDFYCLQLKHHQYQNYLYSMFCFRTLEAAKNFINNNREDLKIYFGVNE